MATWPPLSHSHLSVWLSVFCSAGTGYKSGLNDKSFSESSQVVITATTTTTTINKITIIMSQYVNTSQFELIKFKLQFDWLIVDQSDFSRNFGIERSFSNQNNFDFISDGELLFSHYL